MVFRCAFTRVRLEAVAAEATFRSTVEVTTEAERQELLASMDQFPRHPRRGLTRANEQVQPAATKELPRCTRGFALRMAR